MQWIGRAWRGEERLWKVFWIYGWLLSIGLEIAHVVMKLLLGQLGNIAYWFFFIPYLIWLMVSEWRCAFNCVWTIWGYVVRILIVLYVVCIPLGLIVGGVLVGQDLIKAAECRKETVAYIKQGGQDVEKFKKDCYARKMHKPATGAASSAAPLSAPATAPLQEQYRGLCERVMEDAAKKGNTDPQAYIAQNQAYLQQCIQYYATHTPHAP